ncbi:caspase-23 [Electrophorus electricus]|uniref:Caspase family p20 domain-containing protein n=1 Tax=Electrophorus electricus TaxID=8005 RepID=A0A4W4H2B0_ELEEL|nr:caspase-23 [Electrophorus electricus]
MSGLEEKDNCSEDATPLSLLSLNKLRISKLERNEKSDDCPERVEVVVPCGHKMPLDYLIAWCKCYLKQAKTKFTCPTFDMEKKEACSAKFSYKELCQFAALPPRIKEVFEERLGALTAAKFCEYKICPGCQSYVERDHKTNLCVHCTICTAAKGRTYEFCWNCRKEWKGQVHTAMCCGNSSCEKIEPSQAKCDSLKLCQPAFKTQKLNTEQIYETKAKSSDRKRLAMIINNVKFRRKDFYRCGSEKDEESMRILLEGLGYHVIILNNLSAEGMKAAFGNFSQCNEHRYSDSTFVVIMSHGGPDGICGIYAEDEEDIFPVEKIFQYLDSENCPGLIGKPKIILIQACRGDKKGYVWVHDSRIPKSNGIKQHREKDFACLRSCTPDTVSNRNGMTGSVFIQILVKIFSGHAHEDDIMELFRKVLYWFENEAEKVECYQMPCLERTTLSKKFYLFPGL